MDTRTGKLISHAEYEKLAPEEQEKLNKLVMTTTRLEIIDWSSERIEGGGRVFSVWDDKLRFKLSFQDNNRTLKIFIMDRKDEGKKR